MREHTHKQRTQAARRGAPALPDTLHRATGGRPLDSATRAFMEPRFGHSFANVRVHSDAQAAEAAGQMNADAYALGENIVFGANRYQPGTAEGQHLLAHELAHVVQQGIGSASDIRFGDELRISHPGDSVERAADQATSQVAAGQQAQVAPNAQPMLARSLTGLLDMLKEKTYFKNNGQGGVEYGGNYGEQYKDENSSGETATLEGKHGGWMNENNTKRYGDRISLGGAKERGSAFDGLLSGDYGVFTASYENSIGEDGFTTGLQGNMFETSVTGGKFDRRNFTDEQARLGLSAGEGGAGRLHWGDQDKDGFREYGFGFDVGPVSMDLKTEDPLRTGAKFLASKLPLGELASPYIDQALSNGNATEKVANMMGLSIEHADLGTTFDVIKDYGSNLLPDIDLPKMPDFELPEMPDFELPEMPDIDLPEMPDIDLPEMPDIDLPDMPEMPDIELPDPTEWF
jgi:hypothetical protein